MCIMHISFLNFLKFPYKNISLLKTKLFVYNRKKNHNYNFLVTNLF